jgi:(2Fe-2S) ferredoxin
MKTDEGYYDFHFFVCTNQKEKGADCASKGGAEVFMKLKEWSREIKVPGKRIRINKAGCLNRCAEGIACAAYPKGEWITEATPENLEEIKAWILKRLEA